MLIQPEKTENNLRRYQQRIWTIGLIFSQAAEKLSEYVKIIRMKIIFTQFFEKIKSLAWLSWIGFFLFVSLMAAGYYYNLTFVQLGLLDLGTGQVGLTRVSVAWILSLLAVLTCLVSLGFGWWMNQKGWGFELLFKLRAAFGIVSLQTILTYLAPGIQSPTEFITWVVFCSFALGIGVPVTFSLAVDLIPRASRGAAGAWITGLAYLGANLLPASWTIEDFSRPLMLLMPIGVLGLGLLAFYPFPWLKDLENLGDDPSFSQGRYIRQVDARFIALIVLMFGVFFTDSLGFLRLLETPVFMINAWQSREIGVRLLIGVVHFLAAVIGGVLYKNLDVRELFFWIFGIFALTHLISSFQIRTNANTVPLAMTILYAISVSLYTVVNFSLWADLSTPETIGLNAALGVSLSGWTATFLSTALSIWMSGAGIGLERHLNITDAIAMLFFLGLILTGLFSPRRLEG